MSFKFSCFYTNFKHVVLKILLFYELLRLIVEIEPDSNAMLSLDKNVQEEVMDI